MDRKQLNVMLSRLLAAHRLGRYQGIVIMTRSEADLEHLRSQIEALCLEHDIWRGPDNDGAPPIPCTRRDFMASVFSIRPRGLVILKPAEWMIDWSDLDQMTFWNALADAFGRHDIITLTVATPALIKQLRISFVSHALSGVPISVWLSRHQPVDHLKEVLE